MDINKIIKIADEAYDSHDKVLSANWDFKKKQVRKQPLNGMADTLARFAVVEIKETYEAGMSDVEQLLAAAFALDRASQQCADMREALMKQADEKEGK